MRHRDTVGGGNVALVDGDAEQDTALLDGEPETVDAAEALPFGAVAQAGGAVNTGELTPSEEPAGIVLPPLLGPEVNKGRFARRSFMKIARPGAPTTTRQAEVLNTAIIGSPTDERGVVIGIDRISAAMIAHDPFTAYEARLITSPNVLIMGMLGMGKSSLIKTVYVERPLLLRNRRVVAVDKKIRNGEGEYSEITRHFGAEPFKFDPGSQDTTCLNVMDPVILAGGGPAQQLNLLVAMSTLAGTGELDEWHHKGLREAQRAVMRRFELGVPGRPTPVLPDLIAEFPNVVNAEEFKGLRPATLDLIEERAWSMRLRFERMLGDELVGMFDRETSNHVVLHPKLTSFDISALPEDGPSTAMVMVIANAWLLGVMRNHPGVHTNFIAEEGWHLFGGPGGKLLRANSKLSRGYGLSIVAAMHHLSDVPENSDGIAMIKEAQTIHLFKQEHQTDIDACVKYFNLEESNGESLGTLGQGDHLLKVGTHKEIKVQHIRTEMEVAFTETDSAMFAQPPRRAVGDESFAAV